MFLMQVIFFLTNVFSEGGFRNTIGNKIVEQGTKASIAFVLGWLAEKSLDPAVEKYTYFSKMNDLRYLYLLYVQAHERCKAGENVKDSMNQLSVELLSEVNKFLLFAQQTDELTPMVKNMAKDYLASPIQETLEGNLFSQIAKT